MISLRFDKQVLDGRDAIMLKNHLQMIRLKLKAQALRSNAIDDLLQPRLPSCTTRSSGGTAPKGCRCFAVLT